MPQLGGGGGGDDLGATDEMLAFKDEGEQEEKIPEHAFTERDLADLKSSLVNESEGGGQAAGAEVSACLVGGRAGGPGLTRTRTRTRTVTPLCFSLLPTQAIRRAQDPQRVYQDKLPEPMEDGQSPPLPSPRPAGVDQGAGCAPYQSRRKLGSCLAVPELHALLYYLLSSQLFLFPSCLKHLGGDLGRCRGEGKRGPQQTQHNCRERAAQE